MLGRFLRNIGGRRRTAQFNARVPNRQPATAPAVAYFAGDSAFPISMWGPRILNAMPERIAGLISDQVARRYSEIEIGHHRILPVVTLAAFREVASREPVQVVHFCDDIDQYRELEAIKACGPDVAVVDFLSKLYDFNLPHTYLTMQDERAWWGQHRAELARLAARFGDHRSVQTLEARVESIMSGDRRSLIEASLPSEFEYFNNSSRYASLVPGEDDIYVDIGAAHGDTVDKFSQATAGRYRKIFAFEPTPAQYSLLATREKLDPRIKTFQKAVGDMPGPMSFYDNPISPFGNNPLVGETEPIEVQCVCLDDVVEHCTMIKMDVEGFECNVLRGAERLIRESRPDMAITCYHYPQDMMEILDNVLGTHAYRNVALRHYGPYLYDSVLMFSDRQAFDI